VDPVFFSLRLRLSELGAWIFADQPRPKTLLLRILMWNMGTCCYTPLDISITVLSMRKADIRTFFFIIAFVFPLDCLFWYAIIIVYLLCYFCFCHVSGGDL
jgi:hypothetical protein